MTLPENIGGLCQPSLQDLGNRKEDRGTSIWDCRRAIAGHLGGIMLKYT